VRWVTNLVLFLGLEAVYAAVLAALVRMPFAIGVTVFVVGALSTLPMLPIYLVVVAGLPAHWTDRRRRAKAIAASPLLLTLFAIGFGAFMGGIGLFLFVVALPGALIYGALVRLRPSGGQSFMGHPISD
jgi:hypothetical protein